MGVKKNLVEEFQENIRDQHLFKTKDKLLIALSGGVDSVVLCELCKQSGYQFSVAHCNFQLRGDESERDEQFVRKLAEKYQVEIFIKKFETEKFALENKLSIQEAARKLRYDWFYTLLENKQSLLTAHHSDDNIETVLMNFFRGTGLHGLTGIPAIGNRDAGSFRIQRPLLPFSKEELVSFAKENNLDWVEDSSNESSKYTRNFFRNEILPAIAKIYPAVKENLGDNINRFVEIEKLYKLSVGEIKKKLLKNKGTEVHIAVRQLMGYKNRALIYEIIAGYGFSEKQVDELVKLSKSESGKFIQSPGSNYRIIRHRHWFIITPTQTTESKNIVIEKETKELSFDLGKLVITETSNLSEGVRSPSDQHPTSPKESGVLRTNNIVSVNASEIEFPLLLRKYKTGDYFYPLGMKKKKKLNRFFIDLKLSKTEKENTWVIESNKRIAWVVGYRIDERFKITPNTKTVLQIQILPSQ